VVGPNFSVGLAFGAVVGYLLSAFAVISYTKNWVYICFAAAGSWVEAYVSMTWLGRANGASGSEAV
jgi:hypothetical protein